MKKSIISIIITLFSLLIYPVTTKTLTYQETLKIALQKNLKIKMFNNSSAISKNSSHPGKAGLLPSINLSANMTYQEDQAGINRITTGLYGISSTYTIFNGLGNINRFNNLKIQSKITEYENRNLIELTLMEVSQAFFNAALARKQLKIAEELVTISNERFIRAEKRSKLGRLGTINFLSAKVDLSTDKITLSKVKNYYSAAIRALNILLNQPLNTLCEIKSNIQFNKRYQLSVMQSQALIQNASYLAARGQITKNQINKKIINSADFPRVNLMASYNFSGISSGFDLPTNNLNSNPALGFSLSYNIFNGMQKNINKKNAQIQLKNAEMSASFKKQELKKDIIDAYQSFQNEKEVYELEIDLIKVAELNFERTQELFNLGQMTTTQFRDAQLKLIQAKTNLATAQVTAKLKEISLLYLTGQLIKAEH